jgi:hypothetical protein
MSDQSPYVLFRQKIFPRGHLTSWNPEGNGIEDVESAVTHDELPRGEISWPGVKRLCGRTFAAATQSVTGRTGMTVELLATPVCLQALGRRRDLLLKIVSSLGLIRNPRRRRGVARALLVFKVTATGYEKDSGYPQGGVAKGTGIDRFFFQRCASFSGCWLLRSSLHGSFSCPARGIVRAAFPGASAKKEALIHS